jgi:hypothetical protein
LPESVLGSSELYIKRQQDFTYRHWRNPWVSRPTLQREFYWLRWCQTHGIPSIKPLAYWESNVAGAQRAILITAGLSHHIPLSHIEDAQYRKKSSFSQRRLLIKGVAQVIALMHSQKLQHRCLYSKHIYIDKDWLQQPEPDIRLLDLEKARAINWIVNVTGAGVFRDLDSLNRHAQSWTRTERLYFLREYVQGDRTRLRQLYAKLAKSMDNATGGR